MTIPIPLLVARRRLVLCLDLRLAPPTVRLRPRRAPDLPAADAATDTELVRLSKRPFPVADRTRWEAQSTFFGFPHH
jgi:hypothetical protein